MDVQRVLELDELAAAESEKYTKSRFIYSELENTHGRPFLALLGPRGSGKTVLLRQLRNHLKNSIYISADTFSKDIDLRQLIHYCVDHLKIEAFFIDEIHFVPDYAAVLKELYDFTSVRIWFTSSVSLSLYSSSWDLSRRVKIIKLLPFSFREYLFFKHDTVINPLPIKETLTESIPPEYLGTVRYFDEYLKGGLYPFFLESGVNLDQFSSIIEKIIRDDIPNYDKNITVNDLLLIKKVFNFIGLSPLDGINYSSVSGNAGITKYKAEQFLKLLERCFLIKLIVPRGTNVLKEPKVAMELPFRMLFRKFNDCIGELREDFFALAMEQHGIDYNYVKSTRGKKTPDYLFTIDNNKLVVEIGGAGKGRARFKGVEYDTKIVAYHSREIKPGAPFPVPGQRIPLHCLGFS
jgi:uncharacterized protein